MLTSDQKILATIAHIGILFGAPLLAPLLILFLSEDSFVKVQAKEALFFQGGILVASAISYVLTFMIIGFAFLAIIGPLSFIAAIVATIKIWNNYDYSYPITGKWARRL